MLKHWTQSSKVSCLVITYSALPKNDNEIFQKEEKVGWSSLLIYQYALALEVDLNYLLAYEPLMRISYSLSPDTLDMIDPFLKDLKASGYALQYLMELYIFMVTNGFYDARGRVLIRNCVEILQLSREEYFAVEVALAHSLHECEEQLARAASHELNKDSTKVKRYLKIGAAGLGAGAVIAFTGGLAAPAVAAAFLLIGGSAAVAAAGFATFTVLASVFGTAGAGLAGYKMARRTKGIEEFEFEQFGDKGQLAVCIMVSGWMDEEEDFKRTFGILPSAMTLVEALTRFYMIHDKGKVNTVKSETDAYELNPQKLVDHVTASYGMCPLTPMNLSTPCTPMTLSERDQELLERLIRDYVMSTNSGDSTGRSAKNKDGNASIHVKSDSQGSVSKSAGRFFRGAAKFSSSLLPSSKPSAIEAPPSSQDEIAPEDGQAEMKIDVAALENLKLEHGKNVTGGALTVDVHLIASRNSADIKTKPSDSIPGKSTEMIAHAAPVNDSKAPLSGRASSRSISRDVHLREIGQQSEKGQRLPDGGEEFTDHSSQDSEIVGDIQYWNWTDLDIAPLYELYLLKWETQTQLEIGTSLRQLMNSLQKAVAEKMLMFTVAGLVLSAVALPYTLLKLTDIIDSTWVVALGRADAAGIELAEALLNRPQGSRPVTLVGHSIGARLIFSCLQELSRRRVEDEKAYQKQTIINQEQGADMHDSDTVHEEEDEEDINWAATSSSPSSPVAAAAAALGLNNIKPSDREEDVSNTGKGSTKGSAAECTHKLSSYGLIQDVVLLGIPVNTSKKAFQRARSIVTGRLINGYSNKDLSLAFLYRWGAKEAIKVAGLQAVGVDGVENIDLSFMIEKHTDYSAKMKQVLSVVDFGRSSGLVDV